MSLFLIRGSIEQGLIYSLVALGLYLSFRTLKVADMTVDGSFTLGAAVSAALTAAGYPVPALFAGFAAGALAGGVTGLLQTKLNIQSLLAGIITMTGLYSVNLRVMGGRANMTLLRMPTVFSIFRRMMPHALRPWSKLILIVALISLICVAVAFFLHTRLGLSIRATGDNPKMVRASSINPKRIILIGLCLANALPALSGALIAQYQQFSDVTMGTGMVVIGLASMITGEVAVGAHRFPSVTRGVCASFIGGPLYWLIIAAAIASAVPANDLKLLSAAIVAVAISWPQLLMRLRALMKRRGDR